MGVLDKIKNALFEVEYVEVEEPPKKEKKVKTKEKEKSKDNRKEIREDKPIAKRVVLPGKREEKVEELEEEELLDKDFEARPKEEENHHEEFKFMDDNDFKVDDGPEYLAQPEPEVVEEKPIYNEVKETIVDYVPPITGYNNPTYSNTTSNTRETNLYGMSNNSYNVPVHQYGTYEKETKTYFKPSPIISPIYGVLDKNYKKEDVREKKEVRLSSYSRSNMNVDDIRNKAFGESVEKEVEEDIKFEVDEKNEDNVMVDLSDRSKPEVKELTMGDAEEYFEDLGLEYNVDYVDVSTDRKSSKVDVLEEEKKEEVKDVVTVEEKEEPKKEVFIDDKIGIESNIESTDDDNLFDLIDSMYQENE